MGEALRRGAARLAQAGVGPARLEAEVLLAATYGWTRAGLLVRLAEPITPAGYLRYIEMVEKRAGGYPLQYLTGHQEFMSLDFLVTPAVLIPRADTEVLVEAVLELAGREQGPWSVVDVGTGSGAIAISLAHYLPEGSRVWAVDLSDEALELARTNANRNGVDVTFVHGDLLEPFLLTKKKQEISPRVANPLFDVVVSNPPYIPTGELAGLAPELAFEPCAALDGGEDGVEVYRRLVPQACRALRSGGYLAVEVGWNQGPPVVELISSAGCFEKACIRQDYAGRDRVVIARKI
ncbi:hypothetical protein SY88_12205 [Clostridiales bacterium PH28_bin88]|nr:hypothetical protein SY88_12205 [Clostridiales bacterium PH28_bin88]